MRTDANDGLRSEVAQRHSNVRRTNQKRANPPAHRLAPCAIAQILSKRHQMRRCVLQTGYQIFIAIVIFVESVDGAFVRFA